MDHDRVVATQRKMMVNMSRMLGACEQAFIVAQEIGWVFPDGVKLFEGLSFAIEQRKIGLIGRNGVGKSQLLKILVGEAVPVHGSVACKGRVAYLPQNFEVERDVTLIDALQVRHKLDALHAIERGETDPQLFDQLADDWDIENRLKRMLVDIGLDHLDLNRGFNTLSGGEATRIILAGLMLQNPDLLVLDEPTNNLDVRSKAALYRMLSQWSGGLLVVSHDRTLLNRLDRMMELTTLGVKFYDGNYDAYVAQKAIEEEALQRELKHAQIELKKTKKEIQKNREKLQQKQAKGRRDRSSGSQPKTVMNAKREQSEATAASMNKTAERQLESQKKALESVRQQVEELEQIDVSLVQGEVPSGKVVLELQNLSLAYDGAGKALLQNFNLKIQGPERIWIKGPNGCGKTSLLKAFASAATPAAPGQDSLQVVADVIKVGVSRVVYLDQHIRVLNEGKSIIENFRTFQPKMLESKVRWCLAKFLFKGDAVFKKIRQLSGGERLRAAMACLFMHDEAPQLLLLDEPTNHLDLDAIASLEAILKHYRGALMVISHDETFIQKIHIDRTLDFFNLEGEW
jgi:ATPase subunit of ABC transporter with duplicated ATPase domains